MGKIPSELWIMRSTPMWQAKAFSLRIGQSNRYFTPGRYVADWTSVSPDIHLRHFHRIRRLGDGARQPLQFREIRRQPGCIRFFAAEDDLHAIVISVDVVALAPVM